MKVSWRKTIYWFGVNHPVQKSAVHVGSPQADEVTPAPHTTYLTV